MKKKNKRLRGPSERRRVLRQHQKARFLIKRELKYSIFDLSFLTVSLWKSYPHGVTRDIKIHFKKPLSFKEIKERLEKAFGDL